MDRELVAGAGARGRRPGTCSGRGAPRGGVRNSLPVSHTRLKKAYKYTNADTYNRGGGLHLLEYPTVELSEQQKTLRKNSPAKRRRQFITLRLVYDGICIFTAA